MLSSTIAFVILFALIFEFINGFHDTANAIATAVYTKALAPQKAIALAAVMNLSGALVSEKVAGTISKGLVDIELQQYVILAALIGAIIWNLFTWWMGIPSSSSHALIGSLIGAVIAYTSTTEHIIWGGVLSKVIIPLFTSPVLGLCIGFLCMKLIYKAFANWAPYKVNSLFLKLQVFSSAFVAFSHGNNDAQKTMGIITLALVIELMTFLGAPVSTTQVITTSIMGTGTARRVRAVKWGVAGNIFTAWIVTLPATMVLGGITEFVMGWLQ